MKIVTIKKNFKSLGDLQLFELARNVLSKVNREELKAEEKLTAEKIEDIFVPNLTPTHNEMGVIVDDFDVAVLAFMNRGKVEKIVRDVKRGVLENALKLWAMQIEVFAKGDVEVLANSGFELSKQPEPIPHPGAPVGFTAVSAATGQLILSAKKIKGASAFVFEIKDVATNEVMVCSQGNSKCVQHGLKSGTCYDCRVSYIAQTDLKVYSDYKRCYIM